MWCVFASEMLGILGSLMLVSVHVLGVSGSPYVCRPQNSTWWFLSTDVDIYFVQGPLPHLLLFAFGPLVVFPSLPHACLACRRCRDLWTQSLVGAWILGVMYRVAGVVAVQCALATGGFVAAMGGGGLECVFYSIAVGALIRRRRLDRRRIPSTEEPMLLYDD